MSTILAQSQHKMKRILSLTALLLVPLAAPAPKPAAKPNITHADMVIHGATPAGIAVAVAAVNARQVVGANDHFWANAVFHPTEFLDTDWGKEHLALLRSGGVTLKFVRIYNQPEDASYLKDDGGVGYRWDHFDRRADMILSHGCRLPIGGPVLSSTETFKHPEHFRDFLQHVVSGKNYATGQQGSPIDYLAVHTYGGSGAGGSTYEKKRQSDFEGKRTVQTLNGFDKPLLNGYRLLAKLGGELLACRTSPDEKRMGLEQLEKPRTVTIRGKLEVQFDLPCNAVSLLELVKLD